MQKVDKIIVNFKSKSQTSMAAALLDISDDDLTYTPFPKLNHQDREETVSKKITNTSCWNNIRTFVICVALFNVIFATLEVYIVAILSTIEKKFGLSSSQAGSFLSIKEIVIMLTTAVITHLAKNTHRPRFVAATGIVAVVGGFLAMLAYPLFGKSGSEQGLLHQSTPEATFHDTVLCRSPSTTNKSNFHGQCLTDAEETYNGGAYTLFAISSVFLGKEHLIVHNGTQTAQAVFGQLHNFMKISIWYVIVFGQFDTKCMTNCHHKMSRKLSLQIVTVNCYLQIGTGISAR